MSSLPTRQVARRNKRPRANRRPGSQHRRGRDCTYQSVARNKQTTARKKLLEVTADRLVHEEVEHLIIESSDERTNQRDQAALLAHYRDRGGVPFAYDWRSKQEPILWIADAINGVVHDSFAYQDDRHLNSSIAAGYIQ